jgi:hypothetical protein
VPWKEACDGECAEDDDSRGDSFTTIGGTFSPRDRATLWDSPRDGLSAPRAGAGSDSKPASVPISPAGNQGVVAGFDAPTASTGSPQSHASPWLAWLLTQRERSLSVTRIHQDLGVEHPAACPPATGPHRLPMFPFVMCRDGPPELVIRRKHPVLAVPVLPRRWDEVRQTMTATSFRVG